MSAETAAVDYDALVEKGAGLVHDGHMTVEDTEIPTRIIEEYDDPGFTAEDLREDVQAFLDEHTPRSSTNTRRTRGRRR